MTGANGSPILVLEDVTKSFGGVMAVDSCSFGVPPGSITGLIGPNGAGKTTTFNLVTGVFRPDAGSIRYGGENIIGVTPDQIARKGLVRTFQIPRVFARMTVWENLMFAAPEQADESVWQALVPRIWQAQERALSRRAWDVLAFIGLDHLRDDYAGSLSGGQRKLLELARVLMMDPRLILLDEPMAGVNPTLARSLIDRIEELNERGITFLIIEHDIDMIMNLCDHIVVMHHGRRLAAGDPETVRNDPRVLDAYLGGQVA